MAFATLRLENSSETMLAWETGIEDVAVFIQGARACRVDSAMMASEEMQHEL